MDFAENDYHHSVQIAAAVPAAVSSSPEQSAHGDKLTMNATPNGYTQNHKLKHDGHGKPHNESPSKHSNHTKHSSDHVKRKDGDFTKHSSSGSHSKPKDGSHKSNDISKHKDHDKEKKHSSKHSSLEHSKHSSQNLKNGTDKVKSEEKSKHKEHRSSDGSHKHSSSGDIKKDKSKEKPKSEHSISEHKKEKSKDSDKHKESKDKIKHSDGKHHDKHKDKGDKPKEKHSDKPKDKHGDKHKEKHKDKGLDKSIDKSSSSIKIKTEKDSSHGKKSSDHVKKSISDVDKSTSFIQIKTEPESPVKIKDESMNEEDMPLSERRAAIKASKHKQVKSYAEDEDSDDEPIMQKVKKIKTEKKAKKRKSDSESDDDYKKPAKKAKKVVKKEPISTPKKETSPKKKKKEEEEQHVWKWWEEGPKEEGVKWRTLQHNGPVFAPLYERVPKNVKFYYDGKHMELSELTEEVAGFYGRMLDHEYTTKDNFNTNFFKDWRKVMTPSEKDTIKDLKKCNFARFNEYYKEMSEQRKAMTKEEKAVIKKENEELTEKYGFCIIDGHKQKMGNFKIEPPGLFRGRGEHPKMGMLKRRVQPEDVTINIGEDADIPDPPSGHKWKKVLHDNKVTWLASWNENILNSTKYVMLNPSSKLKGEKDWQKYETARKLKIHVEKIRQTYTNDFKSKEMRIRQRAVALYFIDKLALRAGNEKDEDTADTVGCCSLRVEHITLDDEKDGKENVVSFDFLGKDSIRYENSVPVEKRAYKNLKLFMENKQPGDDLFDRLNTGILNKYLTDLMEGLTAKVFRTFNASKTLQEQLDLLTKEEMSIPEKLLAYNRANRAVAVLCNHQRAIPKTFSKSMDNLKAKMDDKKKQVKETKHELKLAKGDKNKVLIDKKKRRLAQLEDQLKRLEVQATDKEENKQIALGTSKLNYLDPRISVAWCKKWEVPVEKIYNKTQRDKFRWALEMAGPDFVF